MKADKTVKADKPVRADKFAKRAAKAEAEADAEADEDDALQLEADDDALQLEADEELSDYDEDVQPEPSAAKRRRKAAVSSSGETALGSFVCSLIPTFLRARMKPSQVLLNKLTRTITTRPTGRVILRSLTA